MSPFKSRPLSLSLIIFSSLLLMYLSLRTKNYYWDGIAFAYDIEHASSALFHPNHLLYGPLGYLVWSAANRLLPGVRCTDVLQILNAFFGSAAVAIFCALVLSLFRSRYIAASLSLALGFSATWWKFSTDANSYIPGVFFLLAALSLTGSKSRFGPVWVGILHAVAMMLHELAIFFTPVLMLRLWHQTSNSTRKTRYVRLSEYIGTAGLLVVFAYYAVFAAVFHTYDPVSLLRWVTSYSQDAAFSFNLSRNLVSSLLGHVRLFWGGRLPLVRAVWNPLIAFSLAALVVLLIILIFRIRRGNVPELTPEYVSVLRGSVVWVAVYCAFLFFWLPHNTFYRLFYLPGLLMGAGAIIAGTQPRQYRLALGVAILFFWNLGFDIYPYAQPQSNGTLRIAENFQKIWPAGAVVYWDVYAADNRTIQYFNRDVEWKPLFSRPPIDEIQQTLNAAHRIGKSVWFDTNALDQFAQTDPEFRTWLITKCRLGSRYEFKNGNHNTGFVQLLPAVENTTVQIFDR